MVTIDTDYRPTVIGFEPGISALVRFQRLRGDQALRNYWKYGRGALRIRWGTPGDLTRCQRQLRKYVGPNDAWGLCQNYHKEIFGRPNPRN